MLSPMRGDAFSPDIARTLCPSVRLELSRLIDCPYRVRNSRALYLGRALCHVGMLVRRCGLAVSRLDELCGGWGVAVLRVM